MNYFQLSRMNSPEIDIIEKIIWIVIDSKRTMTNQINCCKYLIRRFAYNVITSFA